MRIKKYYIALIFMLLGVCVAHAQENRTEICIDFRVNSIVIDSEYSDNAARMQEMVEFLQNIRLDSTINLIEVSFCGAASPEGSYQINRKLAQGRLSALESFIRKEVDIPDSLITRNDSYIPWDYLKSQIEESELAGKEEVIAILEEEARLVSYLNPDSQIDSRILKLKALDGGKVWKQLNERFFEQMRNACAVFVTYQKEIPAVQEIADASDTVAPEPIAETITDSEAETCVCEEEGWSRKLHVKTNVIGLAGAIANAGVEVDLGRHWSFNLPVYYSSWNYFRETLKFRTLAIQPEFRYWISEDNNGFYAGAHFGAGYYNFAFGGDYRYQDHDGRTPALGGGISLGYRLPMGRDSRWRVEFSLGAGGYSLHYDVFHNTAETKDGLMTGSVRRTYWGIDQAAVSFSYSFDLKKKGGKR